MPLRLQSDEDPQAMAMRLIEEPARWRHISPHSANAVRRHRGEAKVYDFGRRKCIAITIRTEGSVRHAANVKLFVADPLEFAPGRNSVKVRDRSGSKHEYGQG